MLKTRLIVAFAMIGFFLAILYFFPPLLTVIALAVVAICAWELGAMTGIDRPPLRVGFCLMSLVPALVFAFYAPGASFPSWFGLFLWCLLSGWIASSSPQASSAPLFFSIAHWLGPLLLNLSLCSFFYISGGLIVEGDRLVFVLYAFALVVGADSFAYLVGKRWGRRKLAPLSSPNKTVEGVLGAFLITLGLAVPFLTIFGILEWRWMLVGTAVVLLSVIGDLTLSRYKRLGGIKDSGNIFPGHGGMLDRFASHAAGLTIFACGFFWLL